MPIYEIEAPNGKTYEIEGPEGATLEQLVSVINKSELDTAPTGPEPDFIDQLEEAIKGIPAGAINLGELAALGLISPLGEESELSARQAIQETAAALRSPFEADPGSEQAVGRKFGEALGSFVGLGATTLIPGVGIPATVARYVAPRALAGGAGAGEASERARAADATAEERATATVLGAGVGLSELIPINILGRLRRGLGDEGLKGIMQRVKRAAVAGGAEGAQEAAAGIAQNLIEAGVYNPEQGAFTDTGEAFGYGAGVGGFVQGILDLALPKTRGRGAPDPEETSDDSVEETLALGFDPAATITFEDGSTAQVTRSEAEELGLDFDAVVRANELQAKAIAEDEARRAAIPDFPGQPEQQLPSQVLDDAIAQAETVQTARRERADAAEFDALVAEEQAADQAETAEIEALLAADEQAARVAEQERFESELSSTDIRGGTARERATEERRYSILQDTIEQVPTNNYNTLTRNFSRKLEEAGLTNTTPTERERVTIERAVNVRKATTEEAEVSPRGITATTTIPTDSAETGAAGIESLVREEGARRKPEQPSFEGMGKRGRVEQEPEPAPEPSIVTEQELDALGVSPTAAFRKSVVGKDFNEASTRAAFERLARNPRVKQQTRENIYKKLQDVPQEQLGLFEPQPTPRRGKADVSVDRGIEQEPSGVGVPDTERVAEGEPQPVSDTIAPSGAERTTTPELGRLGDTRQRAGTAAFGTAGLGSALANFRSARISRAELQAAKEAAEKDTQKIDAETKALAAEDRQRAEAKKKAAAAAKRKKVAEEKAKQEAATKRAAAKKKKEAERKREAEKIKAQGPAAVAREERKRLIEEEYQSRAKLSPPETAAQETRMRKEAAIAVTQRQKELDDLDLMPRINSSVDMPLDESSIALLKQGDLKGALLSLGEANENPRVTAIAKALANLVGDTRVVVVPASPTNATERLYRDRLDEEVGTQGGYFPPSNIDEVNNVIILDEVTGLTPVTVLHEMTHAATQQELLKKSSPVTKQLQSLYEAAKPYLSGSTGTENVEEFVAEAFANPSFMQQLATINVKGVRLNALRRFTLTIENFLRRLIKAPVIYDAGAIAKGDINPATVKTDELIGDILVPTFNSRGTGELLGNSTPDGVIEIMRRMDKVQKGFAPPTPAFRDKFAAQTEEFFRSGVGENVRQVFLGFMPSQALSDIAAKYNKTLGELATKLHRLMEEQRGKLDEVDNQSTATMRKVDEWAKNASEEKVDLLNEVISTSTVEEVDPSQPESTYKNDKEKLKTWKQLQPKWKKLGSDGQGTYVLMRNAYETKFKNLKDVIFGRIDGLGLDAESTRSLKDNLMKRLLDKKIVPYFPLTRSGDYKLSFDAYMEETDSTEPVFLMFETARERENYIQEFLLNDDRVIKNDNGDPIFEEYDGNRIPDYASRAPSGFATEVIDILKANNVDGEVQKQVVNSFIETLPETSFAKSFRFRENVAGFNQDHIHAMRSRLYDISRNVVRMEYTNKLQSLARDISGTSPAMEGSGLTRLRGASKDIQQELLMRTTFAYAPPRDGIAQAANRTAFIWTIGFNASSAIVNLSQIPLFVLPMLGGKYGYPDAIKAISRSYSLVTGTVRNARSRVIRSADGTYTETVFAMPSIDNLYERDAKGNLNIRSDINLSDKEIKELEELKPVVDLAMKRGQLNRSLFADSLGLDQSGRDRTIVDRVSSWSAFMFHQVEQLNRQVSILSAYQLEMQKLKEGGKSPSKEQIEEAAQTALYEAQQTNGGSVLETAPRYAQQGVGRVALMYKTYGIQMYYTMLKSAKTMLDREADVDVRKAAFRQLVGVHGSALFFAGVSGLPLFGAFTMIANMFLDDDEDDAETIVRKYIGEGWYKGGVTTMLGVDTSQRMALTNLLFQANRYARNPSPEETIGYYLGGPAWSVGKSFLRGSDELINGNMYRGIESMVPGAIRNGLRSYRYAEEEGARTRRGDFVYDDITGGELAAQLVGFAPAEYARRQEENQAVKRMDLAIQKNRSDLYRKYYLAASQNDREETAEVLKEIEKFNKRVSRRFPRAVITPRKLRASLRSSMRTSAQMHNGITLSASTRDYMQEYLDNKDVILLD